MGHTELIEAILKEGREKIDCIRKDADSGAEKIRDEKERRIAELRAEYASALKSEADATAGERLLKADRDARAIRLSAEARLSERLRKISESLVFSLRGVGYDNIFQILLNELPSREWESVRVNPEDTAFAGKHFPASQISADTSIAGGIEVASGDGRIVVCNTLEKRLDKAWPELLTEVMEDVRNPDRH